MRFSLRTLMLLFPALIVSYGLAYGCALATQTRHTLSPSYWSECKRDLLITQFNSCEQTGRGGANATRVDNINRWFRNELSQLPPSYRHLELGSRLERIDRWGNPYRCVLIEQENVCAPEFPTQMLGFYSCGEDGISHTKGNDPDDLNSWNRISGELYEERESFRERTKIYWEALCLLPLPAGAILAFWLFLKHLFQVPNTKDSPPIEPSA